jgi:hypothetical protein
MPSKKDYETVLSAEAGSPVFLTDAEYARLVAKKSKSAPEVEDLGGDTRPTNAATKAADAKAAGAGYIGKIAMPGAAGPDDSIPKMTYQEPPTLKGIGIEKGWHPKPVDQYAFDASDFGIPASGDVIKAKAPVDTIYAKTPIVGNPALDPWAADEQNAAANIYAAYQAKADAAAAVDAIKKHKGP